jgi:deoxyribose-phosphate aldolase
MTRNELARMLDHSVLKPEASEHDILSGAESCRRGASAYYCVQPGRVKTAAAALAEARRRSSASRVFHMVRTAAKV